MRPLFISLLLLIGVLATSTASAQPAAPPAPPPQVRAAQIGNTVLQTETRWSDQGSRGVLRTAVSEDELFAGGGVATIKASGDRALVAYIKDGAASPLRARTVTVQDGRPQLGEERSWPLPGGASHLAFSVVIASTPDGFTVFYQFVEERDPSAAHTFMLRLNEVGEAQGQPQEIPIPWSLADAAFNGGGYHLALIFPGGPRLSMVSISMTGTPQQHPDWASEAGFIRDIHLVRRGERIAAFYCLNSRIVESDVTQVGSWGQEPQVARTRGNASSEQVLVIREGRAEPVSRLDGP